MKLWDVNTHTYHGPLARYVKLRVEHAPRMPGTFSPPPWVGDPDRHHGTCVTHVPWCMPGSLTSGFLWSQWRGKRPRHARRMRNPQFYVSNKRPIAGILGRSLSLSNHRNSFDFAAYMGTRSPNWITMINIYLSLCEQNDRHFADIFLCIFVNYIFWYLD